MLTIGIISILLAISVFSSQISTFIINNITIIIIIYSALLTINSFNFESLASDIGLYNGLFHINVISQSIEWIFLIISAIILISWGPKSINILNHNINPKIYDFNLLILFSCIGTCLLISSSDIISMFLSIEIQSFSIYILSTLYYKSENAGIKYYLLGGLSSTFILLGCAFIYNITGLTNFESIFTLFQVINYDYYINNSFYWGIIFILVGFLFKVSAAPLHSWSPDVYDGVPTIITSWLIIIPKISILTFLLIFQFIITNTIFCIEINNYYWNYIILISSFFSLIIGSIVGLSQIKIKRLLTYSTISHVGFILFALSINTKDSIEAYIFYLIQYSITNLNIFLILLAFGYLINYNSNKNNFDIDLIEELSGQFNKFKILSISFALCLFSIAGIPPLIGFFAKINILFSAIQNGSYFIAFIAIIVSIISCSYYLKILSYLYFNFNSIKYINSNSNSNKNKITNIHSFFISILTIIIVFFIIKPSILLNLIQIISFSIYFNLSLMNYLSIKIYIYFIPILVVILLILNLIFAIHRPDSEKVQPYECGFSPVFGQTRNPFSIQFYLVGILFLVFDTELTIIFPLAVNLYQTSVYGFWIFVFFFKVLTLGFIYEFGTGALYFNKKNL